jgi:hypothetical protein
VFWKTHKFMGRQHCLGQLFKFIISTYKLTAFFIIGEGTIFWTKDTSSISSATYVLWLSELSVG